MNDEKKIPADKAAPLPKSGSDKPSSDEVGGRKGPEPTRFGDWENKGKCVDF